LIFQRGFASIGGIKTTWIYVLYDARPGDLHCYIGKSNHPSQRYNQHFWERKKERTRKTFWIESLLKLGLKPTLKLLLEIPVEEWEQWERMFIHWYRVLGWSVVNVTEGGEGMTNPTEEVRAKCALGRKGKVHTPEARAAIGAAFRDKPLSEEHRIKLREARKKEREGGVKRTLSPEHRANISAANRGRKLSEDQKQKIRERMRTNHPWSGKHHTDEARAAIGAAFKGKSLSEEHKAKITASRVGEKNPLFGKHLSEEHKAKLRAANLGRKMSAEFSEKLRAANTGKKASAESRERMRLAHSGRRLSPEHALAIKLGKERKKLTASASGALVTVLPSSASNPA